MSNNILIKRINKDINVLKNDNVEDLGIYYDILESDIRKIRWLIMGPEETPYRYGYYFFDMEIPDDYPFVPPKVTYQTRINNIRFNPNMYCCGKVCVSILNTWSGPQWTSCQSLKSVIITLQSLLTSNPLENEPGYNDIFDERHEKYRNLIEHENFSFSILNPFKTDFKGYECFKEVIISRFLKNYPYIRNDLYNLSIIHKNQTKFTSRVYQMDVLNKYNDLLEIYIDLYNKITNIPNLKIKNDSCFNPEKRKKKKFVPNLKASNFEVGYKCISENNNCLYVVSLNTNNIKRWSKVKK